MKRTTVLQNSVLIYTYNTYGKILKKLWQYSLCVNALFMKRIGLSGAGNISVREKHFEILSSTAMKSLTETDQMAFHFTGTT